MSEQFNGVRIAGPEDENEIFDLLMLHYTENGMAQINSEKVTAVIRRGTRKEGGVIGVVPGDRGIKASIGLQLSQWWYTNDYHLEEMWNFVHPEHRRSRHAKNLILWAKWMSDQMHVPAVMGILTVTRLEPKMRLMQRQCPQIGALFAYGPVPSDQFNQRRVGR